MLSVCSLLLIMFLPCRLIIDPGGSVSPRGTGCDSDWKLVLLQPGLDTQLGGTPSVCSCISLTTLLRPPRPSTMLCQGLIVFPLG